MTKLWPQEIIKDYPGVLNNHMSAYKREVVGVVTEVTWQQKLRDREVRRCYTAGFEKWRMGPWTAGHRCSLEAIKGKEPDCPLEPADTF